MLIKFSLLFSLLFLVINGNKFELNKQEKQEINLKLKNLSFKGYSIITIFNTKSRLKITQEINNYQKNIEKGLISLDLYENEVKKFLYGLIIISSELIDKDSSSSNINNNNNNNDNNNNDNKNNKNNNNEIYSMIVNVTTIEETIRLYSSDILLISIRLKKLAETFHKFGYDDQAIELYELTAIILNIDKRDDIFGIKRNVLQVIGDIYFGMKLYQQSLIPYYELEKLYQEHSQNNSNLNIVIGNALIELGELQDALNEYQKAIQILRDNNNFENLEFLTLLNISATINMELGKYNESEVIYREYLSIFSNLYNEEYTNITYRLIALELGKSMLAQSKWWHGAILLERCLSSLYDTISNEKDCLQFRSLMKRTAGAYSKAAEVFNLMNREKEANIAHEKSLKVINDWTSRLNSLEVMIRESSTTINNNQNNNKEEKSCLNKDLINPSSIKSNDINENQNQNQKNSDKSKNKKDKSSKNMKSKGGNKLDTLVFITVVLILSIFGLHNLYEVYTTKTKTKQKNIPTYESIKFDGGIRKSK